MHGSWMTSLIPFRPTFPILQTHSFKLTTNTTNLRHAKKRAISHPIQKEMCVTNIRELQRHKEVFIMGQ